MTVQRVSSDKQAASASAARDAPRCAAAAGGGDRRRLKCAQPPHEGLVSVSELIAVPFVGSEHVSVMVSVF